jgi:hypothetical protein
MFCVWDHRGFRLKVLGTFQVFDELLYVVIGNTGGESQFSRLDHEWLALRMVGRHQSQAEHTVDYLFEGSAGAARFFFEQPGYVVIEGKGGSHIMMIIT